jgi:transcriptional regulator with XRE-family HTH domain
MNSLSGVLKSIRKFNRLTQLELSKKIGVSRSYISEIENSEKIPSVEILRKYSEVFDIPLSAILLFTENWDDKLSIKNKLKRILTKTTLEFFNWICKK